MIIKKKIIYLVFLTITVILTINLYCQTKAVKNTKKDINLFKNKVKLSLIRTWGSEDENNAELIFYEPQDVEIGRLGYVYIVDSRNNRIQIFNDSAKYIKTIGRKGKGPGEFSYPYDLALDNNSNLIVADRYNSRIQVINSNGEYYKGFKAIEFFALQLTVTKDLRIITYNNDRYKKSTSLFFLYDYEGNKIGTIGERIKNNSVHLNSLESLNFFSIDNQDNIYIAYYYFPLIQKFSKTGKLIMEITYEIPFKVSAPELNLSGNNLKFLAEKISAGLSIGDHGRIYLVTTTRTRSKEEKRIGMKLQIIGKNGITKYRGHIGHGIHSDITDLYQLLVFNSSGKIIASKQLNHHCDKIKVLKDKIYVVDAYVTMKIYEYKISFE